MLAFIYLLNMIYINFFVFIYFKYIYFGINTPLTTLFCPLYLFIELLFKFIYPFLYHFAFPALFISPNLYILVFSFYI